MICAEIDIDFSWWFKALSSGTHSTCEWMNVCCMNEWMIWFQLDWHSMSNVVETIRWIYERAFDWGIHLNWLHITISKCCIRVDSSLCPTFRSNKNASDNCVVLKSWVDGAVTCIWRQNTLTHDTSCQCVSQEWWLLGYFSSCVQFMLKS